jgi:hypothetical protein
MKYVKANEMSVRRDVRLKELHRCALPDEVFEVTDERYIFLSGKNPLNCTFVTLATDEDIYKYNVRIGKIVEEVKEEEVVEVTITQEDAPAPKRSKRGKGKKVAQEVQ